MRILINILRWAGAIGLVVMIVAALFWKPADSRLQTGEQVTLQVKGLEVGFWPQGIADGYALSKFTEQHPGIRLRKWTSFRIPGEMDLASELMAFAARTAPDVTFSYVHRVQFFIDQGFYKPLNQFIGVDVNGNGIIDDSEVTWKPWLDMPPVFRQMGMRGSTIYALPVGNFFTLMAFRPDVFKRIGLGADEFPTDFASFFKVSQKVCSLTLDQPASSRTYALPRNLDALFLSLLYSAGGATAEGVLMDLSGNEIARFQPEDNAAALALSHGLGPDQYSVRWETHFNTEPARRVLDAMWQLYWQPWILNPHTGEPLNVDKAELAKGTAYCPVTGSAIPLQSVAGGVQTGVCRPARTAQFVGMNDLDLLIDGQLAMMPLQNSAIAKLESSVQTLGFALPPAFDPGARPVVIAIPMLFGLNSELEDRPLAAAWEFLAFRCGPEWTRWTSENLIRNGFGELVSPLDSERLGLDAGNSELPSSWITANRDAENVARVIPYFSGYQQAETEFLSRTIRTLADRADLSIPDVLAAVQSDVDGRILLSRDAPREPWRPFAAAILLLVTAGAMGWGICAVVGRLPRIQGSTGGSRRINPVFWALVLPALLSVAIWSYYPSIRGLLLAFQEYRLNGQVEWVGLLNFMDGVLSLRFLQTLATTVAFIALNVGIGFFAPVILAILLNEISFGKYFFRTLFFLPSVTSVLVIMLLWQVLYEPSADGLLNQMLRPTIEFLNWVLPGGLEIPFPIRFLQDEKLALICVVIPAIWAGVGAGSLIYLAALKSVSSEFYEAAEIDGAGFWQKLTKITLPYLRPLLIINLVGAFVGSAQAWGNIFVLTGGGPGTATQVTALEIWMNAFVFLRFGVATAQAWVLGALLIGFTVWQIKMMQRLDFRRTRTNG